MINEVESATVVRTLREEDIDAIADIDASPSGRRRPQYFRSILERSARSPMQVSLVAEHEGLTAGFLLASVYYGEYGIAEPTASIDAIGVRRQMRGMSIGHELMQQLRSNLAALGVKTFRTEVSWSNFELLGFFRSEGFAPAQRICLELKI